MLIPKADWKQGSNLCTHPRCLSRLSKNYLHTRPLLNHRQLCRYRLCHSLRRPPPCILQQRKTHLVRIPNIIGTGILDARLRYSTCVAKTRNTYQGRFYFPLAAQNWSEVLYDTPLWSMLTQFSRHKNMQRSA